MRAISFLLAFALILAGPSMAGTADGGLPGIGTFIYGHADAVHGALPMVVATIR